MNFTLIALLTTVCIFIGILIFSEIGRRLGLAKLKRDPNGLANGVGDAESAVFGLLGLVIAFTFSGAASRFEERRHLITQEANAIGTAYLRIDLLPADIQPEIRALFRRYLELRSNNYQNAENQAETQQKMDETAALQTKIWQKVLTASRKPNEPVSSATLLLPALNDMIDITTTRAMATKNHPPFIVFLLLAGLSFAGALLVGYDMSDNKERSLLHTFSFAFIMSLALYVIIDLEFPRLGLINIDAADQVFIELQKSMN
ncbi:MAG: DUF4239 domain-containing protein [Burkholderiales bacterium]|nr:DUF4239 domain-containing protein [Burkholderiales bacterium]